MSVISSDNAPHTYVHPLYTPQGSEHWLSEEMTVCFLYDSNQGASLCRLPQRGPGGPLKTQLQHILALTGAVEEAIIHMRRFMSEQLMDHMSVTTLPDLCWRGE